MEKLCLDTDFLVRVLRNKQESVELAKKYESNYFLATTMINVFELFLGAYKSGKTENLVKTKELIGSLEILDLDMTSADLAGQLAAELEKSGKILEFRDLLIGTIALTNGAKFKTYNLKHFERIPGLELVK